MEEKLELLYPHLSSEVLAQVVSQAESFVLDYCGLDEVPTTLTSVLLDMCKQDINRLLSEGLVSEGAGGSSLAYAQDYSPQVYKRLKRHKRMRVL